MHVVLGLKKAIWPLRLRASLRPSADGSVYDAVLFGTVEAVPLRFSSWGLGMAR